MGVVVASGTTTSVSANTRSTDLISGTFQFAPFSGTIYIYGRASATGMNIQLFADGTALTNDLATPFFGSTGALSQKDHEIASFPIEEGSRLEFYLRNTTGGSLTMDYQVVLEPDM
jgi:hypothetical protein